MGCKVHTKELIMVQNSTTMWVGGMGISGLGILKNRDIQLETHTVLIGKTNHLE